MSFKKSSNRVADSSAVQTLQNNALSDVKIEDTGRATSDNYKNPEEETTILTPVDLSIED